MDALTARDVPSLLRALEASDSGRPRVTWYGAESERVELSARVLGNWVAKTANLLVHELDAEPGTSIAIILPPHWRTVVWLLAAWSAGGCVPGWPDSGADVVVASDLEVLATAAFKGARPVAVALPALARSFDGDLPANAVDYAAEISGYGDVFVPAMPPADGDLALAPAVRYAELLDASRQRAAERGMATGARVLCSSGPHDALSLLAVLAIDGSLVLHDGLAEPHLAKIADAERVTLRL